VRLSNLTHKHGRRSAKSEEIRSQWQEARKFVQDQAFFDRLKGESVCRSIPSDVEDHLTKVFGALILGAVPDADHGSVLTDTRGEGIFQTLIVCPTLDSLLGVCVNCSYVRTSGILVSVWTDFLFFVLQEPHLLISRIEKALYSKKFNRSV
jgi:hypothetical protein